MRQEYLSISQVGGLLPADEDLLGKLKDVYNAKLGRNRLQNIYYQDKQRVKNLGLAIPPDIMAKMDTSVGWCAKGVDMLAARSQFDGFTMITEDGEAPEADILQRIMSANDMAVEYSKAVTSELIHSCGFWTVDRGGAGEPAAVINYHDAESAAALWNFRKKRIQAGFVIADWELKDAATGDYQPCELLMYTDTHIIDVKKMQYGSWLATYYAHQMGRPMMEPMCYRPSKGKPFGKSRVSRTMMGITDEMQRELARCALQSEIYSYPHRWMAGADDAAFDVEKFTMMMDSFIRVSKDEDGDVPTFGQFAQASMEPHLAAMRNLASRAAAEASLPVTSLGIIHDNPASAEALRASLNDLIIEAESLNRTNGKALVTVAKMAMAVALNKRMDKLPSVCDSIMVHWIDPSMPSFNSQSDAIVKQVSALPWIANTGVVLERLGYTEDERMSMMADKRKSEALAVRDRLVEANR